MVDELEPLEPPLGTAGVVGARPLTLLLGDGTTIGAAGLGLVGVDVLAGGVDTTLVFGGEAAVLGAGVSLATFGVAATWCVVLVKAAE